MRPQIRGAVFGCPKQHGQRDAHDLSRLTHRCGPLGATPPDDGVAIAGETKVQRLLRTLDFRQVLFFAYVGIALVVFTFLPPPFQKPDEPSHFYRAVSLINLDQVCSSNDEGVYGFQMKRKYTDLPDALHV